MAHFTGEDINAFVATVVIFVMYYLERLSLIAPLGSSSSSKWT